jgi:preprotein translocase subunit SecA
MDHQRKRVYGYRQEILDGASCKIRVLGMLDDQVTLAVDRFMDEEYGAGGFAQFASNRLGVEFDGSEFVRSDYNEAEKTARDKSARMIQTQVSEMFDENLGAEESEEWNWKALSHQANTRYGLSTNDRQLKQLGRENVAQFLIEGAEKAIAEIDLRAGKAYLEPDWGVRSVCDWARLKFQIKLTPADLDGKSTDEIKQILHTRVLELYHQKEIEFPVKVAMARFMADRAQAGGGQRYDREGLFHWAKQRFPGQAESLNEEDFRTQSRARLYEELIEVSRKYFPTAGPSEIDEKLEEAFTGTRLSEADDAMEVSEWARAVLHLEVPEAALTSVTRETARQMLWNAFDDRYRPEMRGMERSLILSHLDASWKNHLYTMDHLRSTVGLRGYAQDDPKTVFKREGMQEFETMWESVQDKITETVFRMEEEDAFQESVWAIGQAVHESAPRPSAMGQGEGIRAEQDAAITNSQRGEKKIEPIRNRGERVGRNDPCPCGSGKKYKNCHMRQVG